MTGIDKDRLLELLLSNQKQSYLQTHELMKLALRTAYILNAGTAAALLTYLGSKDVTTAAAPAAFAGPLLMFAVGIGFAALTTFLAFKSQGIWTSVSELYVTKVISSGEGVEISTDDIQGIAREEQRASCWRKGAIVTWCLALGFFIAGCIWGYRAFADTPQPAILCAASKPATPLIHPHKHKNALCPRSSTPVVSGKGGN